MDNFKNIYNRKEFLKINEGDRNTYGEGQGSMSSFSNNLSLQHTYLGKLLDGMFKSISWLWRKSKENFLINKLMGQFTNELLRGVITYCFANGINIETGEVTASETTTETTTNATIETEETPEETEEEKPEETEEEKPEETEEEKPEEKPEETEEEKPEETEEEKPEETKPDYSIIRANINNRLDIDWENPTPKSMNSVFGFPFNIETIAKINDIEKFQDIASEMGKYLSQNYDRYLKLKEKSDDKSVNQSKKFEDIYMNYYFSNKILKKYEDSHPVSESYSNVSELVKAPMSNPVAGGDPKAKKIKTNVKVKQILTKRDREKYKNLEDELNLNIANINLAAIENEVTKKQSKDKVSMYVNSENLRVIQLTAENLFYPDRTSLYKKAGVDEKSVEKQRLKTKWQKEVNKVLANFSNLLNTDEIRKYFVDKSNDVNLSSKVDSKVKIIGSSQFANIGFDNLENQKLITSEDVTFRKMEGNYAMMFFTSRNLSFMSPISEVRSFNKETNGKAYLLRICNTYDPNDTDFRKDNFSEFKKLFTIGNNSDMDVYFLIFTPNVGSTNQSNMLIFNYDNKKKELYLFNFSNKKEYDALKTELKGEQSEKSLYKENIFQINVQKIRLFNYKLDEKNKKKFGFITNGIEHDYSHSKVPSFYEKYVKFLLNMVSINQNK